MRNETDINEGIIRLLKQYPNIDLETGYQGDPTGKAKDFPRFEQQSTDPEQNKADMLAWVATLSIYDKSYFLEQAHDIIQAAQDNYNRITQDTAFVSTSNTQRTLFETHFSNDAEENLQHIRSAATKDAFLQSPAGRALTQKAQTDSTIDLAVIWSQEESRRTSAGTHNDEIKTRTGRDTDFTATLEWIDALIESSREIDTPTRDLAEQDRFLTEKIITGREEEAPKPPYEYLREEREKMSSQADSKGDFTSITAYGEQRDKAATDALAYLRGRAEQYGVPHDQIGEALMTGKIAAHPDDLELAAQGLILEAVDVMQILKGPALDELKALRATKLNDPNLSTLEKTQEFDKAEIQKIAQKHGITLCDHDLNLANAAIIIAPHYDRDLRGGLLPHHANYINAWEFGTGTAAFSMAMSSAVNNTMGPMHSDPVQENEALFRLTQRLNSSDDLGFERDPTLTYAEFKAELEPLAQNGNSKARRALEYVEQEMAEHRITQSAYSYGTHVDKSRAGAFDLAADRVALYQQFLINQHSKTPPGTENTTPKASEDYIAGHCPTPPARTPDAPSEERQLAPIFLDTAQMEVTDNIQLASAIDAIAANKNGVTGQDQRTTTPTQTVENNIDFQTALT